MAETGLSLRRIAPLRVPQQSAAEMGGPFVPVKFEPDSSPFESRLAQLQTQIAEAERITQALPYLPFRQPLAGLLVTTSPFGVRVDPFLGRMAMHTGNDFRGVYGSRVLATAAGTVISASFDGGYGNMVEIDHGEGVTTRYAHLSAILVVKGQKVDAGEEVGRLGTTGRSTGPHLHYEVRIDGQPVDPLPFVRAGERLFASK
jgi:murein DD-endopeptidase MepM/ murein hydrolase activator NlpD